MAWVAPPPPTLEERAHTLVELRKIHHERHGAEYPLLSFEEALTLIREILGEYERTK